MTPLVLVDAENVRRSLWPNLTAAELVASTRAWAKREGRRVVIVFDGPPPELADDVVGVPHADDELVARATAAGEPVWLVTSDRALRARVPQAARTIGGGSFGRALAAAQSSQSKRKSPR